MSKTNKVGWIQTDEVINQSPCCGVSVGTIISNGVTMGTCIKCDQVVFRLNPTTGKQETPDTEYWG
jgi:hypothetical protein